MLQYKSPLIQTAAFLGASQRDLEILSVKMMQNKKISFEVNIHGESSFSKAEVIFLIATCGIVAEQ